MPSLQDSVFLHFTQAFASLDLGYDIPRLRRSRAWTFLNQHKFPSGIYLKTIPNFNAPSALKTA